MITFDGVSIGSVANVMIDDIIVSPIQYDDLTRQRAIQGGSVFVRSRAGTRTVAITFALLDENMVSRQEALLALSQWAKTDQEYKLELPGHPEHYLMAVCTAKPEPSLRQWWEAKLMLVFTCYSNPYWTSKTTKRIAGESTQKTIYIQGDAPPIVSIWRRNTSTFVRSFTIDDQTISFNDNLPQGDLYIYLNNQTATVNAVSAMQYFDPTSTFPIPHAGSQTITGQAYFDYVERWQ